MSLFLEGVVIGLAVAAPVGPIGVLCIRRTLAYGRASGLVSGLGAATADAAYGSVAALGLTFVTGLLVDAEAWLRLGGGVFLVFLGVKTFLSRPAERPVAAGRGGLPGAYASTLALTLANPSTILSFAAIFAGLGAGSADGSSTALLLVPGVFLVFLGVRTFLSRPSERLAEARKDHLPGAYASTLVLTLANPATILSFAAIFAGLGAGSMGGDAVHAMSLVLGVFCGSALWWFVLSGATSLLRAKLPAGALRWVNGLSGAVLAGFGLVALSGLRG